MDSYAIKITHGNREIIKNYFSKLNKNYIGNTFSIGAFYGISKDNQPEYIPIEKTNDRSLLYEIFGKEISTEEFYKKISKLKCSNYEIYY